MTQNERILRAITVAPSTCADLAAVLKLPMRAVHVGIWVLREGGYIRPTGALVEMENTRGRLCRMKLYEVTGKQRPAKRNPAQPQPGRRAEYLRELGRLEDGA